MDPQRAQRWCLRFGHRQDLLPPAHDPVRFGEESVTPEVHTIAAVFDRFGNSAHLSIGFEHDGGDIGPPQELERRGQPGRSGAGDDGNVLRLIR
jgi:hypothetical protein